MNKNHLLCLLLGALSVTSAVPRKKLFQVMSGHPHDVHEFSPFIETVKKEGRLWLVHLKDKTPKSVMGHFRETTGADV